MIKHNLLLAVFCSICVFVSYSQDSTKNDLSINVAYYNNNNQYQYLVATAKTKVNGKFTEVSDVHLNFYIGSVDKVNLLGSSVTNHSGSAMLFIPASAKDTWIKSSKQSFIAVANESKQYTSAQGDVDITKAKLKIDTASDKKITVVFMELKDTVWAPVKGVDIKVAVKRLDGDLSVSTETPTYTTDSLGRVNADFQRENLPGDSKGNLILVAKVEDNDTYGNLSVRQTAPWGVPSIYVSNYDDRTLFSRRGKSPLWLYFMAYGTILTVWSILIYLAFQIRKIKKLGA
jgi:hypothetical protein